MIEKTNLPLAAFVAENATVRGDVTVGIEARHPLRVENWAIFSHLPESGVKPK